MWALAREFAAVLFDARFTEVVPFKTYDALERALLRGEIDAAWGPPLICAAVEAAHGMVALRGVRAGAVTYRSALLARRQDPFDLQTIVDGAFRPRAAWVDPWSTAGYVLPKAYLLDAGADATKLLGEKMFGSYAACFEALLDRDADLTASFVGPEGLEAVWGARMRPFRVLAYTAEGPNDGIAVSPQLDPARRDLLLRSLERLLSVETARDTLANAFNVDGFDRPPPATYLPLLALRDRIQ